MVLRRIMPHRSLGAAETGFLGAPRVILATVSALTGHPRAFSWSAGLRFCSLGGIQE